MQDGPESQRERPNVLATERAFFDDQLNSLLREHSGQFVLIKGSTIIGFYPDAKKAYGAGRQQFGFGPFYVACVDRSLQAVAADGRRSRRGVEQVA
jgi:hypothetical protein